MSSIQSCLMLLALALSGCAASAVRIDARHPASPQGPRTPDSPAPWGPIQDAFDRARTSPALGPAGGAHRHDDSTVVPTRGHHPAPGASGTQPPPADSTKAVQYVCPMHADVTAAGPAECPKCGMELVPRREGR